MLCSRWVEWGMLQAMSSSLLHDAASANQQVEGSDDLSFIRVPVCACDLQVQAAIQEATPKAGAAGQANGAAGKPHAAGSQQVPVLAEGMEVSLLYVRFRAAAEPSLKGRLCVAAHG
jgi:hypothetical protein